MKISIITISLNSERTIEDTIISVLGQTYTNIEYIIIDGGSTDRTLAIIDKYENRIQTVVSEKDGGLYDALNKGIRFATGDIVGILHSDDIYAENDVIETVDKVMEDKKVDCLWGDIFYVNKNDTNKVLRYWKSLEYKKGKFQRGWHPPHPTFFVKKEIHNKYGLYRTDLPIAADYELMLRFLEKYKISSAYIPKVFIKMRMGGLSNKSFGNIIKANVECIKAFKINNLPVNPLIFFLKPFLKIFQFLR